MKRVYKVIEQDNGKLTLYGANRWAELRENGYPDWCDKRRWREDNPDTSKCSCGGYGHAYFYHYGRRYWLDEFMADTRIKGFHGYAGESAFSGVVIKMSKDGEQVKAFTYIC